MVVLKNNDLALLKRLVLGLSLNMTGLLLIHFLSVLLFYYYNKFWNVVDKLIIYKRIYNKINVKLIINDNKINFDLIYLNTIFKI